MNAFIVALMRSPWVKPLLAFGALLAIMLAAKAWDYTMRDPVIERLVIESERLPAGSPPFTIAFIADIHVAGPHMSPERLKRIVAQINATRPDLVAIAGDFISEKRSATRHYSAAETIAPLAALQARHGVVVVPGNHDHWFDWPALKTQLQRLRNVIVLENEAAQLGPVAIGGVDDDFTGQADIARTQAALLPLNGPRIWLSHSPDIYPSVPVGADLVLAGHTHCGQIAYLWGGSPATMSDYGETYAWGVKQLHGKTLVTTAGLGTSLLPIRLFTQPEIWLIELRPARP